MNILHHKSWHVRNKRNIERVRRDERKAREELEAIEGRKAVAESEARLNLLRSHSSRGAKPESEDLNSSGLAAIFNEKAVDIAADEKLKRDRELAAKREQEKWEKKVGILTYLGQGLTEPEVETPWYLKTHGARLKLAPEKTDEKTDPTNRVKQLIASFSSEQHTQLKNDPLTDMKRYLEVMKKSKDRSNHLDKSVNIHQIKNANSERKRKSSKKRRKHKRHCSSKESHKRATTSSDESTSDEEKATNSGSKEVAVIDLCEIKPKSIEELRAERLKRERAERERAKLLIYGSPNPTPIIETNERRRHYNSQFNPHLARSR